MKNIFKNKTQKSGTGEQKRQLKGCFADSWFLIPGSCCCVVAMLCACSTTSETFDCKAGKGVGCKSISEVNQMVNEGDAPYSEARHQEPEIKIHTEEGEAIPEQTAGASLPDTITVHRVPEEHLRVWVAPFQDEYGNLHESSVVHTVFKPGHWQLKASPQRAADTRSIDSWVNDLVVTDPTSNVREVK